jgi:phosphatidylinositol alpha-1,6-mannosyltransferase
MRGADHLLPVSEAIGRELHRMRLRPENIDVLPMPADSGAFHPPDSEPKDLAFIVPARLVPQKRIDVALRAFALVRGNGLDAILHVVGKGEELGRLKRLTEELNLEKVVRFHGLVAQERMADLMRESIAIVLPSENEGYGLVLVEGALCGRPAIGARSGALEEWIIPDVTGILVEPGDHVGLGNAMIRIAGEYGLAERLGREARSRAVNRTAGPLADRLLGIYRRSIQSRTSRIP